MTSDLNKRAKRQRPKRPTQEDVAKLAGVSRATVSLVLSQHSGRVPISQETREQVLAAAHEIGYSPNPVAQMLARGSNHILGFLSFDSFLVLAETDFYYRYLVGAQRSAMEQNYHILLFNIKEGVYQNGMNSLLLADGAILTGTYPDSDVLRRLAKEQYPFVLLGECDIPKDQIDSVQSDHEPASYEATWHLLDLNHRNIGIVIDELELPHHSQRLAGTKRAVSEVPDAQLTMITSAEMADLERFENLLHEHEITALLGAHRNLIIPTIELLEALSLRFPEDISVICLSSTWSLHLNNPTRVQLNRDKAGQIAVQRLIRRLEGTAGDYRQILIPCDFIIGDTTGPANR